MNIITGIRQNIVLNNIILENNGYYKNLFFPFENNPILV